MTRSNPPYLSVTPRPNQARLCGLISVLLLGAAPLLHAQNDNGDPPNRVARISVIQGNVSLEPNGVDAFSQAEINYPLTSGDRVYADNNSFRRAADRGPRGPPGQWRGCHALFAHRQHRPVRPGPGLDPRPHPLPLQPSTGSPQRSKSTPRTAPFSLISRATFGSTPTRRTTPRWSLSPRVRSK